MPQTTAEFLTSVARRAFNPTDQQTFSNADVLALADEEIETLLLPEIIAVREEFFVTFTDVAIVAGQTEYAIPIRAVGNALREVKLVVSNQILNLPRIEIEEMDNPTQGQPERFYLRENKVGLYPTPSSSTGTLRLWFFRYPSKLVETFNASQIASVASPSVTVTAAPPTWGTSNTFDIIQNSGVNEPLGTDLSVAGISGNTLTFSTLPVTAVPGAWVALAGESPIIQLPREYRTVLAQAVTCRILESLRLPGASDEKERLKMMLEQTRKLISPRVVGENRTIVNRNWF